MTDAPSPRSRQESQRHTREALVVAAREAFARDGYHAANLEVIARDAGFSKGAVYSNFASKAELFLAVMDANLEAASAQGGWDMFGQPGEQQPGEQEPGGQHPPEADASEIAEAIWGFALASLEFIATAARDEALAPELGKRMQALTGVYQAIAEKSRSDRDELTSMEIGTLLTALDQGAALLTLGGSVTLNQGVLRSGMQRLLDPGRASASSHGERAGGPALHDQELRKRIASALTESHRLAADEG